MIWGDDYVIDGFRIRRVPHREFRLVARFTFGPCKVVQECFSVEEAEHEEWRVARNPSVIQSIEVWNAAGEVVRKIWDKDWSDRNAPN